MTNSPALYRASFVEAGHTFAGVDVLPMLARSRLATGYARFKAGGGEPTAADNARADAKAGAAHLEKIETGFSRA